MLLRFDRNRPRAAVRKAAAPHEHPLVEKARRLVATRDPDDYRIIEEIMDDRLRQDSDE